MIFVPPGWERVEMAGRVCRLVSTMVFR